MNFGLYFERVRRGTSFTAEGAEDAEEGSGKPHRGATVLVPRASYAHCQRVWVRNIALRMVSIFRMQATSATFAGLPAARSR
jgi:hypothetical protein